MKWHNGKNIASNVTKIKNISHLLPLNITYDVQKQSYYSIFIT